MAIGVNLEGRKELLGLWLSEATEATDRSGRKEAEGGSVNCEPARFRLSVLTDRKNRGKGEKPAGELRLHEQLPQAPQHRRMTDDLGGGYLFGLVLRRA